MLTLDPMIESLLKEGTVYDIYALCKLNPSFRGKCKDDELWQLLYKRQFPKKFNKTKEKIEKNANSTWQNEVFVEYECGTRERHIRDIVEKKIQEYTNDFQFTHTQRYGQNGQVMTVLKFQITPPTMAMESSKLLNELYNLIEKLSKEKKIINENSNISHKSSGPIYDLIIYVSPC